MDQKSIFEAQKYSLSSLYLQKMIKESILAITSPLTPSKLNEIKAIPLLSNPHTTAASSESIQTFTNQLNNLVPHQLHDSHSQHHHHHHSHHSHPGFYPSSFIHQFLLIKIHSLSSPHCHVHENSLSHLVHLFNNWEHAAFDVIVSNSDEEIMAQIILHSKLHHHMHAEDLEDLLHGSILPTLVAVYTHKEGSEFFNKMIISFVLAHCAQNGKSSPFFDGVHQSKNHKGQIHFARRVSHLAKLSPQLAVTQTKGGQDAYSIRCAPQVYGVAFDALENLEKHLHEMLNKPHFKYLHINGVKINNIGLWTDHQNFLIDSTLCALHEIGNMTFIRTERTLNTRLAKTNLEGDHPYAHIDHLKAAMERTIYCVTNNRLLCSPSSADTLNISNYQRDVFANNGKCYHKYSHIMHNLHNILTLEVMASLACLEHRHDLDHHEHHEHHELPIHEEMQQHYDHLLKSVTAGSFNHTLEFLTHNWQL